MRGGRAEWARAEPGARQAVVDGGGGATVALVAVAIVVAIGAGGSVYAFMNNKGGDTPTPGPSSSASGDTAGNDDGGVPDDYLGTWSASCSPGKATELTLLPDGTLRRATTGSGESLIYTRPE